MIRPAAVVAAALLASGAFAERLPVRAWGAADGLGHDHVRCAFADRQGFLWFCTAVGLTRFDGARFQRFGAAEGLPPGRVLAATQTADGAIWAGTERGLWRLDARAGGAPRPRFQPVERPGRPPGAVHALVIAPDGALIVAGEGGLERADPVTGGVPRLEPFAACAASAGLADPRAVALAGDGTVWAGGENGRLIGIAPDVPGCIALEVAAPGLWVRALRLDRAGRLWIGSDAGLAVLDSPRADGVSMVPRRVGPDEGFVARRVRSLFEAPDGTLWVGAVGGLHRRPPGAARFERWTMAHGLPDDTFNAFALDRNGQLWLASDTGGVARLLDHGFVSFDRADGLGHDAVDRLFEDGHGRLIAGGEVGAWISRFDGERFIGLVPRLPPALAERVASSKTWALEDRAGEWWIATVGGLLRYARPAGFGQLAERAPLAVLGRGDGLPSEWTYRLHETAAGELWIATAAGDDGATLARLAPDRDRAESFGPANGLPATGGPGCFADLGDELLVGWSDGSILRRHDGGFERLAAVPGHAIQDLHVAGDELWIATAGDGVRHLPLARAVPGAALADGPARLAGADVRAIASDRAGTLLFATTEGLVELDPAGRVRGLDAAAGSVVTETTAVFVARDGAVWLGGYSGVSRRLAPTATPAVAPAPLSIRALEIDGAPVAISPLGQQRVGPIALGAGRHRLQIGWLAPAFGPGERLRARHRVLGVDPAWSAPTEELSLTLAGLAPGRYRFEALPAEAAADGPVAPAVVEWTIAPPFWSRPWVLALALAAVAAAALLAHRSRVARLVALERVRARIAGDLHDDLSASLTRISVLSEVAARRAAAGDDAGAMLAEIGGDARGLLESTRDLVWAIDPRDESLAALAARLRAFLDGVADPERITVSLATRGPLERVRLGADVRRHLLLVLKEAIHNAVRHAGARTLRVEIAVEPGRIVAEVADDGVGFEPLASAGAAGRGLRGQRARAAAIGARLELTSAPGAGTRVRCELPRS